MNYRIKEYFKKIKKKIINEYNILLIDKNEKKEIKNFYNNFAKEYFYTEHQQKKFVKRVFKQRLNAIVYFKNNNNSLLTKLKRVKVSRGGE
jgi:hypothetical protein